MGKFTAIPKDTFDALQLDAGVLLNTFNPASIAAPQDGEIICATTGGINATCVPTFSDLGEDVDNCPVNTKELKHLDGWECKMSFTALGTSPDNIKMALGCADVTTNKITPRRDLKQTDFKDELWWVGDRADGGCVAICLKNACNRLRLAAWYILCVFVRWRQYAGQRRFVDLWRRTSADGT